MSYAEDDALPTVEAWRRARTDGPRVASCHPAHEQLLRIRASLPSERIREVRMFGAIAVMVDGAMAVAVHKDGSLLVRVDPAEDPQLIESLGASRAEMGKGRTMGEGWIRVEASALTSDESLDGWLEAATRCLARRSRPTS